MIPIKTIGSIINKYRTDGHSPYLVLDEELDKLILKPKNNRFDAISIQKEYLCSILLNWWHIKTPLVYICDINKELYETISEEDKRFKLSTFYFGSQFLENQFELNKLFSFSNKVALRNFDDVQQLIHIALFDIWIENDDRKPTNTNLLCSITDKKLQLIPIDHAFTFAHLSFDSLSPDYVSFSDNDSILYSEVGISIVRSLNINEEWIKQLKDYFYLCIKSVEENIDLIFNTIPTYFAIEEKDKEFIKSYLFSEERLREAFDILLYIIEDIRK